MNKNAGFTLIEVLVTMVIMAIGLLGLAGLQGASLKNNQSAYYRSQASQLAYDLADRMRANIAEAGKGGASTYITKAPSAAVKNSACTTVADPCSPAQMAENDLAEWYSDLIAIFPGNNISVSFADPVYTISISWDDNHDGGIDGNDPNLQIRFRL